MSRALFEYGAVGESYTRQEHLRRSGVYPTLCALSVSMPSAAQVKGLFNLTVGSHRIGNVRSDHVPITQNEKYHFPAKIELSLQNNAKPSTDRLLKAFKKYVSGSKVVYSQYGSPYNCSIEKVKLLNSNESQPRVEVLGEAVRRRDIPTMKEQQDEQKKAMREEESELMKNHKDMLKDYRVLTSRFRSSHCARCHSVMDPGDKIAKLKAKSDRGGWSHLLCMVKKDVKAIVEEPQEEIDVPTEPQTSRKRKRRAAEATTIDVMAPPTDQKPRQNSKKKNKGTRTSPAPSKRKVRQATSARAGNKRSKSSMSAP
eukprot:GILK01015946.1.p1 GENE.GILK01015946.1~~GILK01015946.1.p1  ORF type:complete len:313 (+),score=30.41 GILK01015946.1:542-1480(+)